MRPNRFLSLSGLRDWAQDHWSDPVALAEVESLLRNRTSLEARELHQSVAERIAALAGPRRGFGAAAVAPGLAVATPAELQRKLDQAEAEIARLKRQLESEETSRRSLYERVGLSPASPDFLVKAARKAFRFAHHPDTTQLADKAAAQAAFVSIEGVFDQIYAERGLDR